MRFSLVQSAAPAVEPVSLAEAKAHLRVEHDVDNTLIERQIRAAREYAETTTGLQLITATWKLYLSRFPGESDNYEIVVPRPPFTATSLAISYVDIDGTATNLSSAAYQTNTYDRPGRIKPAYGYTWPSTREDTYNAVTVTYTAGFGATSASVPEAIRQAILLIVGHMYEHREPMLTGTIVSELPITVGALLAQSDQGWIY